jgi:hypothetical protein
MNKEEKELFLSLYNLTTSYLSSIEIIESKITALEHCLQESSPDVYKKYERLLCSLLKELRNDPKTASHKTLGDLLPPPEPF